MKLPFIIMIDDDPQVLGAIRRDIRNRYHDDYKIAATESAIEALELLKELKVKNETVALIISDQRMDEMEGIEFLEKAGNIYPESKQVLLTAYSDIEAAILAINKVKLDHYLLKPWSPPEDKLFPVLDELLDEWQSNYKPDHEGLRIIGFQWSPKSHALKEFLSRNLVPYLWIDAENDKSADEFLTSCGATKDNLPVVILKDGTTMYDPSIRDLGGSIGLRQKPSHEMYDVAIIGAGPAGLAASVYGSCEGLKTILIESRNPGGQAGDSSRIENYLGFPSGLSGAELTRRAIAQTLRFGTEVLTPQEVMNIRTQNIYKIIELSDGREIYSKAIIISTGVQYRRLEIEGIDKFTGAGVYYGSAAVEAHACRDQSVYFVGGGNSACQAVLYLSKFAKEIFIVIRKDDLKRTAADYLVQQIKKTPNVKILGNTEVIAVGGDNVLNNLILKNNSTGEEITVPAKALFIYIGTKPSTAWLGDLLIKDQSGFIVTGRELLTMKNFAANWKEKREPYLTESCIPGIFIAGDVRHGALAGISSAVGEGAMAVRYVRKYLQEN